MKFNTQTALWALIGSFLIVALPFFLQSFGLGSLLARAPVLHLSLAMLSGYFLGSDKLYMVVLPVPYLLTLYIAGRKQNYAKFILFSVVTLAVVNVSYFFTSVADVYVPAYAYGLKIAVWENFAGFGLALGFAVFAIIKKSHNIAHFANLTLFITLVWFAFPYFGAYP